MARARYVRIDPGNLQVNFDGMFVDVIYDMDPGFAMDEVHAYIGDEVFKGAVDVYFQEWKFKHPSPWDFFNTIERAAGVELDWFWSSWYYETWQLDHAVAGLAEL